MLVPGILEETRPAGFPGEARTSRTCGGLSGLQREVRDGGVRRPADPREQLRVCSRLRAMPSDTRELRPQHQGPEHGYPTETYVRLVAGARTVRDAVRAFSTAFNSSSKGIAVAADGEFDAQHATLAGADAGGPARRAPAASTSRW